MSPLLSWLIILGWIALWWLLITRYDRRDYGAEVPTDVAYVNRIADDLHRDEVAS